MHLLHFPGIAASLVMAFHAGSHALEERRGSPGNVGAGIENCVSVDWIHFGKNDRSVTLDDADHRLVRAEMIRRYPVIETDGDVFTVIECESAFVHP